MCCWKVSWPAIQRPLLPSARCLRTENPETSQHLFLSLQTFQRATGQWYQHGPEPNCIPAWPVQTSLSGGSWVCSRPHHLATQTSSAAPNPRGNPSRLLSRSSAVGDHEHHELLSVKWCKMLSSTLIWRRTVYYEREIIRTCLPSFSKISVVTWKNWARKTGAKHRVSATPPSRQHSIERKAGSFTTQYIRNYLYFNQRTLNDREVVSNDEGWVRTWRIIR